MTIRRINEDTSEGRAMRINRIILDLDEVLADFVGGACQAWGSSRERTVTHWEAGKWDVVPPLGKAVGMEISPSMFWNRIESTHGFWNNLAVLPWAEEVLREVRKHTDDWHIVTSPAQDIHCYHDKTRWLRRFFGQGFTRFSIHPHKEIYAQPGVVLIDDREETCNNFVQHGGTAILFPAHHNSRHAEKDDPLKAISDGLEFVRSGAVTPGMA